MYWLKTLQSPEENANKLPAVRFWIMWTCDVMMMSWQGSRETIMIWIIQSTLNDITILVLSDLDPSLNLSLTIKYNVQLQHWFFTFTRNTATLYPLENIYCEFHDQSRWVFFSESQPQPFPLWDHESWVSRDEAVTLQQLLPTVLCWDCQTYLSLCSSFSSLCPKTR